MTTLEFDARDIAAGLKTITPGDWEVSYGEIWSGGDLAIMSTAGTVATLVTHDEDDADEHDVANAELLVRAPALARLALRLAMVDPHAEPEEFDTLQADAVALLRDLAQGWQGETSTTPATPTCEYTADGADPTPDNPACGRPATVMNPRSHVWFDYEEWYCAEHADPAWVTA